MSAYTIVGAGHTLMWVRSYVVSAWYIQTEVRNVCRVSNCK